MKNETQMGGKQARFPTTEWTRLDALQNSATAERSDALDSLIRLYWKPVYCYIRQKWDCGNEEAKDLAQGFFAKWLEEDLFKQVDRTEGRLRSFMRWCLDNFLRNQHRHAHAKKRYPSKGLVSIHKLTTDAGFEFEPIHNEKPEAVFDRVWLSELLLRVLRRLEQECRTTAKETHYELFNLRIIRPSLEETDPPPLQELGARFGLPAKTASNYLVTMRRAFQRLLREELQAETASDEDVAAELRNFFDFFVRP